MTATVRMDHHNNGATII
jgi:hypothetical protein